MDTPPAHHGEELLLELEPYDGVFPREWGKDREAHLAFPRIGGAALLRSGARSLAVVGRDDTSKRRLRLLRELDPPRYCWIVDREGRDERALLRLMVHRYRSRLSWSEELQLGVDERIVERVARITGRPLDPRSACRWLAERVLTTTAEDKPLVVATGAPDEGGKFRLLGRGFAVDVVPRDGGLLVDRVVAVRKDPRGFRPPEHLIEVPLRFDDATATGKVRGSVRAQLERIVAESDKSYLALWEQYQGLEREQLARRARELGWVEYSACKYLGSGVLAFKIVEGEGFEEFRQRLTRGRELETGTSLPPEVLGQASSDGISRPFVGRFEGTLIQERALLVQPLDEDSDIVPPRRGYIFGALQGDRTRLARREAAVQRLCSADARIPQLALILEGEPAPVRRTDRVRALSSAARRVFKFGETEAQRRAIDQALNTPDIALIQGPPGTGKTTVIAALQVRLAEIEAEHPALGGRTLLTSYQHGAVDNAVDRTTVFGLPPARIGGRRGSSSADDQADRWAFNTRRSVEASIEKFPEDRPCADYRRFRDRVAAYAAGKGTAADLDSLVSDLLALDPGVLPTEVWDRLLLVRKPQDRRRVELSLDEEMRLEQARGLAVDDASFRGGGPDRARRALRKLRAELEPEERALLERASTAMADELFPELDALASLRARLIARLDPSASATSPDRPAAEIFAVLNAAIAALHDRMRGTEGSIADALREYADTLHQMPDEVLRTLRHYSAIYAATCQQSVSHEMSASKGALFALFALSFENVVIDEAARANPLDLMIPMSIAKRRIILVGDHRQLPHLLEPDIERELSESVSESTAKALRTSLFERLFEELRQRELRDGIRRVETLDQQFRMHPTLGELVSDVFYAPHREGFQSPRPAHEFAHPIAAWTRRGRPACVAWKQIPFVEGGERRSGTSWCRDPEATWIARHVRELIDGDARELTIGIISFYRAQVDLIMEALVPEGLAEHDPDSGTFHVAPPYQTLLRDGKVVERLRVGTVDAFQGMEFDVVLLSIVRSNRERAEDEASAIRKFGHLVLPNRLCVAMSRQQRLLIAVGDDEMFRTTSDRPPDVPGLSRLLELCEEDDDGLVC